MDEARKQQENLTLDVLKSPQSFDLPPIITPLGRFPREVSEVLPALYLSDVLCARRVTQTDLGITHIVAILDIPPGVAVYPRRDGDPPLQILHISLSDTAESNLLERFDETTAFIKNALSKPVVYEDGSKEMPPKVLCHCMLGMSRSAAVVCAYLVATTDMTASEALAFLKTKRPVVSPNTGFMKQLEEYSRKFFASTGKNKGKQQASTSTDLISRIEAFRRAAAGKSSEDE